MSSTCSGLGKCSSEHSTCSSRFCQYIKFFSASRCTWCLIQFDHLLLVVQCDNVLLWPLFRLDISLQWGALCQLLTQVRQRQRQRQRQNRGTFVNILPREDLLWPSSFCSQRPEWKFLNVCFLFSASWWGFILFFSVLIEIPGCIFSIFVIDCWGRKPVLSLCQVNCKAYFCILCRKLTIVPCCQVVSGLACICCSLLQGSHGPVFAGLQVQPSFIDVFSCFLWCRIHSISWS